MQRVDVTMAVENLVKPLVESEKMELVDVEYKMEQGSWVLRLYIDKPGGVTVDDCSDVSTELGMLLDVKDIITHAYNLEVSSPGLDRPLTKEKDFLKYTGKKVRIKTKQPISGRRNFSAILDGFSEGKIFLFDSEGKKWEIPFDSVEKARLEYEL